MKLFHALPLALPFLLLPLMQGCSRAQAQAAQPHDERDSVSLMVYKDDFAMINEHRTVDLSAGRNRLHLTGVSKSLDPHSVIFDWPGSKQAPQLVSNVYDLGTASGQGLLKRLEGKEVELLW